MGKERDQAASVPWQELAAAISGNPQRSARLGGGGGASASIANLPTEEVVDWLVGSAGGWVEDTTFTVQDAVSFSLWIRDPLYRSAAPSVRKAMEMEEAAWLLHSSESAWKEQNGRVRGWIRKHLEEDLRLRAGGGDPAPDAWETVRTVRRAALLVDYICVMRGLRFVLWWPEQKAVTVLGVGAVAVNLNCTSGRVLVGSSGFAVPSPACPALILSASKDISWIPAASLPSIGSMTVAQIQEALVALEPDATKTGGRVVLWNRLQWIRLLRSLEGKEIVELVEAAKPV